MEREPGTHLTNGLFTQMPIALCSDVGPMFLPASNGGVSDVPKLTALCLKADIAGTVQYH